MTIYPAFSCHQPWATLIATPVPCRNIVHGRGSSHLRCHECPQPMVKRFETRSRPCPPKYIGQRVAIHAAKKMPPSWLRVGDYSVRGFGRYGLALTGPGLPEFRSTPRLVGCMLPLGAVVATAVITASLLIAERDTGIRDEHYVYRLSDTELYDIDITRHERIIDISDQLPYGDWTPGRYAWELADVEPLEVPVPWKGRQGWFTVELP